MKLLLIIAGSFAGLIVTGLLIGMLYVGMPSRAALPPSTPGNSLPVTIANTLRINSGIDQRRKFAFGLESSTTESSRTIKNARYTTEGEQSTVLIVIADGISASDCSNFQNSTDGQSAVSIGFTMLTCRNGISGSEWSIALSK